VWAGAAARALRAGAPQRPLRGGPPANLRTSGNSSAAFWGACTGAPRPGGGRAPAPRARAPAPAPAADRGRPAARAQARCSLKAIAHLPEAEHLVRAMLAAAPKLRPGAAAAMAHPFFWAPERQLAFLVALSDRMECEDREARARLRPAPPASHVAPRGWRSRVCASFASSCAGEVACTSILKRKRVNNIK